MIEVRVPKMGMDTGDVGILQVLVAVGDRVTENQPVVEIEGDKSTFEVEAGAAGVIVEVLVERGQDANIGDVLVRIDDRDLTASRKAPEHERP